MKVFIVSILIMIMIGCSEKDNSKELNSLNAGKDMPTPKSKDTTTNPNEDLAPQTCYYGCKARK